MEKNAVKQAIKCICRVLLLIVIGSLAGTLLLAAVFLVPVKNENKAQALELLQKEGWYPLATEHQQAFSEYFHSYLPDVMDNNTDTIMISTALDQNEGNPLVRAMNMYSDYLGYNYSRYWHGYVSVLRPLFYFFDYSEIRILNGVLQIFIMFVLMHMVWQKKGMRYAVLMMTSYALLMPVALSVSFQFSWVFYIGSLGCLILMAKSEYWGEGLRYVYLFAAIGMLSSYFDLLTYPLFTWGIPVIWWLLADKTLATRRKYAERCIFSGISWAVGYVGIWGMKWLLGSWITGNNVIEDAVGKVQEHAASGEGSGFTLFDRLEASYINFKHYEYPVYMLILVVWLVWLVVRSYKKGWHFHKNSCALLLAAATSPAWYFVLAEHTSGHHFFAYRIWNVAILAVLAILLQATEEPVSAKKQADTLTGKAKILVVWALAAVCGVGLALTAREDLPVHNGGAETIEIPLSATSCIEADFVPTFSKITQIGTVLYVTDTSGVGEISVSKDQELLYMEQIPLEKYGESSYAAIEVDWKLKAGEQYNMTIRLTGADGDLSTALTIPSLMPLNELQNTIVDGQDMGGQPILGITYQCLPTSGKTLLYLACCFGGAVAAMMLCGIDISREMRYEKISR